jgi:multiple sugar transport system permease protein
VARLVHRGWPAVSLTPFQLITPGSSTDFSAPLRNYRLLPGDPRFVNSLWVQAKLSFWGVLLQVLLGMLLALLLNTRSRVIEFARTFFLIPMVLPPIVVAVIWKLIYMPDISPIYYAASLLHVTMPSLTSSVDFALTAIIIADTWEWLPFTFLMVLAALQTIPDEYSEAALVDGASPIQIFFYVTLPFIAPVLVISAMFRLKRTFGQNRKRVYPVRSRFAANTPRASQQKISPLDPRRKLPVARAGTISIYL